MYFYRIRLDAVIRHRVIHQLSVKVFVRDDGALARMRQLEANTEALQGMPQVFRSITIEL